GFRPDHLLTLRATLPQSRYSDVTSRLTFYTRVIERVRNLPGVESIAYGSLPPFLSQGNTTSFHIEGRAPDPSIPQDALYRAGTPDYLRTIGAQLVSGRLLDARDGPDAPLSVVINETMARGYFPYDTPLGHRMSFGRPDSPLYTIVGVIKDVRERGHELAMKPAVYLPYVREIWAVPEYLLIRARS